MASLFTIMTLAEWDHMAHMLSRVLPPWVVWPAFIVYILVVSYSMTSLITGCISESLIDARMSDEKVRSELIEDERMCLSGSLKRILGAFDRDGDKKITEAELLIGLRNEEIHRSLRTLDVEMAEEEYHELFQRLSRANSDSNGEKKISVDLFVEAMIPLTGPAKASAVFDLKTDMDY